MPILRPNAPPPGPQHLGFIILRQEPGKIVPMSTEQGAMAIFATAQNAIDTAKAIADQELRPSADQKIVTPAMKSHKYLVAAVAVVGEIQAQVKNPEAMLADKTTQVN